MSFNKRMLSTGAAASLVPSEHFKVVTYAGNSSTQSITVGFQPDIVWIKERDDGNENWNCYDSSRGIRRFMGTHSTAAEVLGGTGRLTSFDSTGFTIGNDNEINDNGANYVAYCWKVGGGSVANNTDGNATSSNQVNLDAGVSIMKLDSHSGSYTIGHGLEAEPHFVLTKVYNGTTGDWHVYHTTTDSGKWLRLNTTAAVATASAGYEYHTVNSSLVGNLISNSSLSYIHYAWKNIDGFSKFGSYTGNGSTAGPIIDLGFEPAFIMFKRTDSANGWNITDNQRDTANPRTRVLQAHVHDPEYTSSSYAIDFLSNGFQIVNSDNGWNTDGGTYIYMAFAADPDEEAPTLANSFAVETYTGSDNTQTINTGFKPGLVWTKSRSGSESHHGLFDIVRGGNSWLISNNNDASVFNTGYGVDSFNDTGVTFEGNFTPSNSDYQNLTFVGWFWAADDNEPKIFGGPPEAVYTFESNANDLTGMKNGTANNITYASGKFNNAAVFNGTDGDIDMPADWEGAQVISVSLWLYLDDNAPTNQIVLEFDNGCGLNFPSAASGKLSAQYHNANSKHTLSNSALSNNTWYHVVANFENGSTGSSELWLNGVKQTSGGTVTDYLTADENTIGSRRSGEFLDGMIDQLRVFNYHLSQNEVDLLYTETSADNEDIDYGAKPMAAVSINANAGFSISRMTFPGEGIIPHGLSSTPEFVILKDTSNTNDWQVYHTSLGTGKYLLLNSTAAVATRADSFSAVNATGVTNQWTNASQTWMMYSWHSVTGYSKFGTYNGNGTTQTITTGFKPDFVMIKSTGNSAYTSWIIFDSGRFAAADDTNPLYANLSDNESVRGNGSGDGDVLEITFTSAGFKLGDTGSNNASDEMNDGSNSYIYAAFAKNVTSNSTLANSFNVKAWTGTGSAKSITGLGFRPDLIWIKQRSSTEQHYLYDQQRGPYNYLHPNLNNAEGTDTSSRLASFDSDGFSLFTDGSVNGGSATYVAWCWKAGNTWESNIDGTIPSTVNVNTANGFSIVKWTGDGSASATVGHNLSSKPDMVIIKNLSSSGNWNACQVGLASNEGIALDLSAAAFTSMGSNGGITYANLSATTFGFATGTSGVDSVNKSGDDFIAYCFHSVAGFSKFGSYSGTSSSNGITGVGFKPNFVLIKERDGGDSWQIYDSIRGTGNVVYPNGNNAEYAGSELTSFDSDGFTVSGNSSNNESGKNYIYATFKINVTGLMSWLCIGGGGEGGGESNSGGGGAGGLRTSYGLTSGGGSDAENDITLAAGTYTITVGAGGTGNQTLGGDGGDSSIAKDGMTTITSAGGGGGAGQSGNPSGRDGGSGGGGGYNNQSGGDGTANQGYGGGAGVASSPHPGGGGGGASEAGNTDGNGTGGDGLAVSITGSSVTYAGGGSGGVSAGNSAIAGSDGGGGAGAAGNDPACVAGTANTGSGGGGGAAETKGADGGSGVVILRLLTSEYSGSTTGSPTVTTDGDYTVIKYTGSGTYVHS